MEKKGTLKRAVHTRGTGAFGYFEVTNDIRKHCKADLFSKVGEKTPVAVRFSTSGDGAVSADTLRDPRGFALRFFTKEGHWDLVGSSMPIFFFRDPKLLATFAHAQKRNPTTQFKDVNTFWDFLTTPEATHMASLLFSERGIPDGYRHMNGYGVHTFKLVNAEEEPIYCKFHFKTGQGVFNLTPNRAHELVTSDPDYATRDLYRAIQTGLFPSWTLYIQVMSFNEAEKWMLNPFDPTIVWPQVKFPLIKVGEIVLDRNPKNYLADIESFSFSPHHLVPGIEASPDMIFQKRLTAYTEAQTLRLGINPDDGTSGVTAEAKQTSSNGTSEHPNDIPTPVDVERINLIEDDYLQAGLFYRQVLDFEGRSHLVTNIVNQLVYAKERIQDKAIMNFSEADPDYGRRIKEHMDKIKKKRAVKFGSKLSLVLTECFFSLFQ